MASSVRIQDGEGQVQHGEQTARQEPVLMSAAASAAAVNRTRRVVRERADGLQRRRRRVRSLVVPLVVCAAFVLMSSHAVWSVLAQYEVSPTGIPDASDQMLVFLLWFLPVTAALLAVVWLRRSRSRTPSERAL